jgi:hypothetical protein
MLFALGWMFLYFSRPLGKNVFNKGLFPLSLLMATGSQPAFLPFLVGHFIGKCVDAVRRKTVDRPVFNGLSLVKSVLIILIGLSVFFPSRDFDNNHFMVRSDQMPFSISNPLNVGFFQISAWSYLQRHFSHEDWKVYDWIDGYKLAYGDSQHFTEAFRRFPDPAISHVVENLPGPLHQFGMTVTGMNHGLLALLMLPLMPLLILAIFLRLNFTDKLSYVISILMGVSAIWLSLMFTWFSERYMVVLLPLVMWAMANIGHAYFVPFVRNILETLRKNGIGSFVHSLIRNKLLVGITLSVVMIAVVLHPILINSLLSANYAYSEYVKFIAFLITLTASFIFAIYAVRFKSNHRLSPMKLWRRIVPGVWLSVLIVVAIVASKDGLHSLNMNAVQEKLLAYFTFHRPNQADSAYQLLKRELRTDSKILSAQSSWIKGFFDIDNDNVYSFFAFSEDNMEMNQSILASLDYILVGVHVLNTDSLAFASLHQKRFQNIVLPYMNHPDQKQQFEVIDIANFGKLYKRIRPKLTKDISYD